MTMEDAQSFMKQILEVPSLRARVSECEAAHQGHELAEALVPVGRDAGFVFEADEIARLAEQLHATASELGDDELDAVAGGASPPVESDALVVGQTATHQQQAVHLISKLQREQHRTLQEIIANLKA